MHRTVCVGVANVVWTVQGCEWHVSFLTEFLEAPCDIGSLTTLRVSTHAYRTRTPDRGPRRWSRKRAPPIPARQVHPTPSSAQLSYTARTWTFWNVINSLNLKIQHGRGHHLEFCKMPISPDSMKVFVPMCRINFSWEYDIAAAVILNFKKNVNYFRTG